MTLNDFGFLLTGLSIGMSGTALAMRWANAFDRKKGTR